MNQRVCITIVLTWIACLLPLANLYAHTRPYIDVSSDLWTIIIEIPLSPLLKLGFLKIYSEKYLPSHHISVLLYFSKESSAL